LSFFKEEIGGVREDLSCGLEDAALVEPLTVGLVNFFDVLMVPGGKEFEH
jgi:hypothetical protein